MLPNTSKSFQVTFEFKIGRELLHKGCKHGEQRRLLKTEKGKKPQFQHFGVSIMHNDVKQNQSLPILWQPPPSPPPQQKNNPQSCMEKRYGKSLYNGHFPKIRHGGLGQMAKYMSGRI